MLEQAHSEMVETLESLDTKVSEVVELSGPIRRRQEQTVVLFASIRHPGIPLVHLNSCNASKLSRGAPVFVHGRAV